MKSLIIILSIAVGAPILNDFSLSNIIFTILSSGSTLILGWVFARRKNKADAHGSEIDNVDHVLKIYKTMLDDLSERLTEQKKVIELQEREIECLRKDLANLK